MQDPSKAARLEAAAARGYEQQGRGFLFVRVCVSSRSKKKAAAAEGTAAAAQAAAAKGFGARPSAPEPAGELPLPAAMQAAVVALTFCFWKEAGGWVRSIRWLLACTQPLPPVLHPAAGAPLPNNPRLVEHSWAATYIPGGCLAALGGIFSEGSTPLPDPSLLVSTGDVGEAGSSQAPSSTAASGGSASAVEPSLLEELQRALRGMDAGRLAMLVGCSWALPEVYQPAAGGASQGQQQQLQDRVPLDGVPPGDEEQEWASSGHGGGLGSMSLHEGAGAGFGPQWDSNDLLSDDGGLSDSSSGVGGGGSAGGGAAGGLSDPATADGGVVGAERAYEPEACEFVVLLLARVDQQPAIGADIVRAVGDTKAGSTQLIMPGLQGLAFA